jgi:succinyl-diaminopimelate desuccinylase
MRKTTRESREILSLTKQLMGFKTTSDNPKELGRCIDFIERYFSGLEVVIRRHIYGSKPSLVVTFGKTRKPELFLVAHLDVVPCPNYFFRPKLQGRLLFGRGGHDDKGSVAIMMALGKYYSGQEEKPDIGLMFVSDEEIGSRYGVQTLLTKGYSSRFAVILDGGRDDEIVTQEKAPLHIRLKARGRTAHGSTPWEGENAIEKLLESYRRLRSRFPKRFGEWGNTISLGSLNGGSVVNQVPDSAEMSIDMRFISDRAKSEILSYIKSLRGISSEVISTGPAMDIDKDNSYIRALRKSASKVLSKNPSFGRLSGATDARFFVEKGTPSVLMMPTGRHAHSLKEQVDTESFGRLYLILRDFIDSKIKKSGQVPKNY